METETNISTNINNKNLDPISFFEKDSDFVFAYKKTEKLASAIYMITNLFSDNEPLKWSLRKKASELLSFCLTYKDISEAGQFDFIYNLKTRILEIVSLFEVAYRGGLVSGMNFSIVKNEFSNLTTSLEDSHLRPTEISQNPVSEIFRSSMPSPVFKREIYEDSAVLKARTSVERINTVPVVSTPAQVRIIKDKTAVHTSDFKKSNRQSVILSYLKKNREATIKDISEIIKDCSEKTIQRELNSLISEGVLKRTGVRRWSKYSISLLGAI